MSVAKKPGQVAGVAQITTKAKSKPHTITAHALEAWNIQHGRAVLVLLKSKSSADNGKNLVRLYDLDSGKRRDLGYVPFSSASLRESTTTGDDWAFALSSRDVNDQPLMVLGNQSGLPGLIPGATSPALENGVLTYTHLPSGKIHRARLGYILGTELTKIYEQPDGEGNHFQIFPDGTSFLFSSTGEINKGTWTSDGSTLALLPADHGSFSIPIASLKPTPGIPAGSRFRVRLLEPLSTLSKHEGAGIKAVAIMPVYTDAGIMIPQGSLIDGEVTSSKNTGWGLSHETASLTVEWNKTTLPDGRVLPFSGKTFAIENAQESTTASGKVQGIRATGTAGNSIENGVLSFAGVDPIAYIFASFSGPAVLGFAEPEILYGAGTELIVQLQKPILTAQTYEPSIHPSATSAEQQDKLQNRVKALPYRTKTKATNKASDITNLVFLGSPEALQRAFAAAGWRPTDNLTARSTFKTIKTLAGNESYTEAPMSVLLLDERAPVFTLSKTTNTFSARHHLRVFPTTEQWDNQMVLTASSTQDTGIAFSRKQRTFIHVIDQYIDNEREKIVNDLSFTGCVQSIDMVPRPWVPQDAYNSTGDQLRTDGQAAVLHINECKTPRTTATDIAPAPNRFQRSTRDTLLSIRSNFYRGNLIYQGIAGGITLHKFLANNELAENYGAWVKSDASGTEYKGEGTTPYLSQRSLSYEDSLVAPPSPIQDASAVAAAKNHKWDPPEYEFWLEGGYSFFNFRQLSSTVVLLDSPTNQALPFYLISLDDTIGDGWAAGGAVTINSWRHFSNEFSYFRIRDKYRLNTYQANIPGEDGPGDIIEDIDSENVGIVTRQFEYNLLAQLKPPTSRWRPYVAVGPTLQLLALADSPLEKPAGPFTLGLKNIGLLAAAFDFGSTPPLDGGGIFQFGLQYGGGIKYRLRPHIMLRADFRQTWSKTPDIIRNSYEDFEPTDLDDSYETFIASDKASSKFLQNRATMGIGFTF